MRLAPGRHAVVCAATLVLAVAASGCSSLKAIWPWHHSAPPPPPPPVHALDISGPAAAFCRVAAQRLDPAESGLRADGPHGATALRVVRTYA